MQPQAINQQAYSTQTSQYRALIPCPPVYLAHRDFVQLLDRYLQLVPRDQPLRILDIGCGPGTSIQIMRHHLDNAGISAEFVGVDINPTNLDVAQNLHRNDQFLTPEALHQKFTTRYFDLVTCFYVLIENTPADITNILSSITQLAQPDGLVMIVNPSRFVYDQKRHWHGVNNHYSENTTPLKDKQIVKLDVFDPISDSHFEFSDYYYAPATYQNAFTNAGLTLLETHYPLGRANETFDWQEEKYHSPVEIHCLRKQVKAH
ncbi:Ubiquinone/menaquinone biosynthesis C-methyltransferase UbiE [BD1-7 clade bacterium]|uniref:Ubiquinone/menaquinone biosynthesis C-methyltransferase UbiE n=1 Tax=BD1-7 clade bacterium TaxID=2029982 RepID=A0A5S9Q8G5_9GAMM|nr:Ubiquinone/menaquinone biosynthesis C-methyltransferase UbiE [BD1-7 clade bacterium]